MIERVSGDLLAADVEALVNPVNCVGVAGRGLALQFRKAYPGNFSAYVAACRAAQVRPGRMFVYTIGRTSNPRYIINFPTKRHWRTASRMEDIDSGLQALVAEIRGRAISSIAVPALGAGLGGLAWVEVRPRIEAALNDLSGVRVLIYEPVE